MALNTGYHEEVSLDNSDSDVELNLQELGPSQLEATYAVDKDPATRDLHQNLHRNPQAAIPLQSLRPPGARTARRTRRFEETGKPDPYAVAIDHGAGIDDSADALNIGDSTPLLNADSSSETPPSWSASLADRLRLPHLTPHRAGYANLEDPAVETQLGKRRTISIGQHPSSKYPPNAISNAKYTPWSFLPRTLYNEFSFFINLYFLLVALSQLIKELRIGITSTYIAPLAFVLSFTLGKEAFDDVQRRRRDGEANKELYTVLKLRSLKLGKGGRDRLSATRQRIDAAADEEQRVEGLGNANIEIDEVPIKSRDLKVGDVVKLSKDQRVPADMVILKSSAMEMAADTAALATEAAGATSDGSTHDAPKTGDICETFVRTDQLDGETDWKLRLPSPLSQALDPRDFGRLTVVASKPSHKVNEFLGRLELQPPRTSSDADVEAISAPLSIDNTAWANTVLASSATVLAVVVYTGSQTRQAMSTSSTRSKVGLLELEINNLTKILCLLTLGLSALLVGLENLNLKGHAAEPDRRWYVSITRFLILFSSIIPISLRINLGFGKTVYAYYIQRDDDMPGAVVRTSTIPEDLGRIEYLLSDKTGTLTQNEMDLRKIHVGTVSYANEAMEEVASYVRQGFAGSDAAPAMLVTPSSHLNATGGSTRTRREIGSRIRDVVLALALCHNVTPTSEVIDGVTVTAYQASSPDEIAIVQWTESVGLRVLQRDRQSITLQSVDSSRVCVRVRILEAFPFTSESKRMGIIVQFQGAGDGEIWFYEKGADTVMATIVAANDWLDEETANMAREGLRTLVVGRRRLSHQQYADFSSNYREASSTLQNRDANMAMVIRTHLEHDLELLGVTGVEDKLQKDVKPSLELLRNAGIKVWMLTGDKVETARCVAISSKLVSRSQHIHTITSLAQQTKVDPTAPSNTLSILGANPASTALLIDGDSLSYLLEHHREPFITLAVCLPAVIACRCSPTQKADVALLIRKHTRKRIACIGDGGNDVSMIQAADVGVGIVGKEGRQASLAADFSITQFHHLTKLLVWHGRNSYKRSAKLAQFVIHRGLIISVCQTVYSIATAFEPNALFIDWLIVGYATVYTQLPVFSLVLDRDVDEKLANLYPELYKELAPGTSLSYRTFLVWVAVSLYQGCVIQILSNYLTGSVTSPAMIALSFSALILNELAMVALEITTWHFLMGASILGTAIIYAGTVPLLGAYFDLNYIWSPSFAWQMAVVLASSLVPVWAFRVIRRWIRPPSYRKVRGV